MKLKTIFHRAAAGALCLILCVSALTQTALAKTPAKSIPAEYFGTNPKACSLTLKDYPYQGMTVKLYRIADVTEDVRFTATNDFKAVLENLYGGKYKDLNISSQDNWKELAKGLDSALSGASTIKPYKTATTNNSKTATFSNLQRGLYLIVNDLFVTKKTAGGSTAEYVVDSTPMLVCLPNWMEETENGTSVWDWTSSVEIAVKTSEYLKSSFPLTVTKAWLDVNGNPSDKNSHPSWVTVELYQDNTLYGTKTLDRKNWSCTWTDLPAGHKYWIREVMPDGTAQRYSVEITQVSGGALNEEGILVQAVTIRLVNREQPPGGEDPTPPPDPPSNPPTNPPSNSPSNPPTNPPSNPPTNPPIPPVEIEDPDIPLGNLPDPDEPPEEIEIDDPDIPLGDLPQTGQLWWPVPLMGVVGLFLLLIGCVQRRRGEYDEE